MATSTTSGLSGLAFVNPQRSVDGALASGFQTVPPGGQVELPVDLVDLEVAFAGAGRMFDLAGWNAFTHGTSLVVVRAGRIVHEWYAPGVEPSDTLLGASMTKSALAHLVGLAVGTGAIRLEDRVVEHVPELEPSGYAPVTVLDLLTMTSGVDWAEDHRDPDSRASRLVACFGTGGDSRELLRSVPARSAPGTRYEYCTADSQVLDWVRERATGLTYTEALSELWDTLGCCSPAYVGVDGTGVCMAGGSLAATARDWARLGMLQVDGTVEGRRALDEDWILRSTAAAHPFLETGRLPSNITTHVGFGLHWWPTDDTGRRVAADGSRGQFTYVDRDLDLVVVKTSQWPYDDALADRQCRDLSYLGLRAVAEAATRS